MPLVTLDRVSIAYGHVALLDGASLQIEARARICVIGRNGTGKSTLLRLVGGELEPDGGSVWQQPGLRIGRLAQDVLLQDARSVFDVVAEGAWQCHRRRVAAGHAREAGALATRS